MLAHQKLVHDQLSAGLSLSDQKREERAHLQTIGFERFFVFGMLERRRRWNRWSWAEVAGLEPITCHYG